MKRVSLMLAPCAVAGALLTGCHVHRGNPPPAHPQAVHVVQPSHGGAKPPAPRAKPDDRRPAKVDSRQPNVRPNASKANRQPNVRPNANKANRQPNVRPNASKANRQPNVRPNANKANAGQKPSAQRQKGNNQPQRQKDNQPQRQKNPDRKKK